MVYRRATRTSARRPRRSARTLPRRRRALRSRPTRTRYSRSKPDKCLCPGELTPTAKFALAQIDPFDPNVLGAKIPDSNTMPSLANQDVDQVPLTLVAGQGFGAIAFFPNYRSATLVATNTAGTLTWPTASLATRRNYTNISAQLEAIRPVAHAIRISSSLSATTATGFVHIGLSVEGRSTTVAGNMELPVTVNEMTGLAHYKRFTLSSLTQSPLTAINKWIDETAFRYESPDAQMSVTTAVANFAGFVYHQHWASIVVMVEGAPVASTCLSAEHVLATEALPKKDSFVLGTQAAPNSPGTMSAVSAMQAEGDFSHTEAGQGTYVQQSLSALAQGAATAGTQVFNGVAVPLLTRIGHAATMTAATMAYNAMTGTGGLPGVNSNPNRLSI